MLLKINDLHEFCDTKEASSATALRFPGKGVRKLKLTMSLDHLTKLDGSKNELDSCMFAGRCPNLTWLNLSHNRIEKTKPLSLLDSLRVLTLSHNLVHKMSFIAKLRGLRALILNHNRISVCPALDMPQLNTLVLSHNSLKEIDVSGLPQLVKLQLSHNALTRFPDVTSNRILKVLLVNENLIEKVPESHIGSQHNWLENVDLGKNKITKLRNIKALHQLVALRMLNLLGNPVCDKEDYQAKALIVCPRLHVLDSRPITKQTSSNEKNSKHDVRSTVLCNKSEEHNNEVSSETNLQQLTEVESRGGSRKRKITKAEERKQSGVVKVKVLRRATPAVSVEELVAQEADIGTGASSW